MNTSWSGDRVQFPTAMRATILRRDKWCAICGQQRAVEADHIRPVAECRRAGIDPDTLSNGQGLCHDCHAAKTSREIAAGKTRMTPRRQYRHPSDAH